MGKAGSSLFERDYVRGEVWSGGGENERDLAGVAIV